MRDKHSLENFGILENPRVFWNFEEFKKNPRFFGILVENLEKPKVFFGIYYEIPKIHWFFKGFWIKFQKNLGYFWNSSKFQKKNIEFSKIPKFQKIHQSHQIFLEFWKTQGFFGILKNSKKP